MINGPIWDESRLDGNSPTILAIGDSWFWYPANNLANPLYRILNRDRQHVMLVRGRNGAATQEYVAGHIREQIEFDLDKARGYGRTIQAVFLSGGGNDFAGPKDMLGILQPDCSAKTTPEECYRRGQPARLMGTAAGNLLDVAQLVARKLPHVPVLVHGYDYANPNGKGFFGLGQWLQYPMDKAMIRRELQQSVVNNLLEAFSKRLDDIAKECANIHCVNCLGTLKREEWANELHPMPTGFNRLARKWTPVLQAAGLIP